MKITNKNHSIAIKHLSLGDCFRVGDEFYVRCDVSLINTSEGMYVFHFNTNKVTYFHKDTLVTPINGEVVFS